MRTKSIICTFFVLFGSSSALATDIYDSNLGSTKDTAVYSPVYTWTGFYLGVHAGYAWGNSEYEHKNDNYFGGTGGLYDNDTDGALLGGQIGFNYQIDNVVIGVEGTHSWSNIEGNNDYTMYFNDTTTELDNLSTIAGRLGLADDKTLYYFKVGYAIADVTAGQDVYGGNGCCRTWSDSEDVEGWFGGIGVEYALTHNFTIGVEGLYYDFDEVTFSGPDSADVPAIIEGDLDFYEVKLKANLKLN